MIKNYLKITLRNLKKHKLYSFINILSLTIGITVCILITLYIKQEFSYDKYFENASNIYRITTTHISERGTSVDVETPMPLADALAEKYPEIGYCSRIFFDGNELVKYKDKSFIEKSIAFADSDFLKIFSFKILNGNPSHLLDSPHSMVLTKKAAEKYFGSEDPIGKVLKLRNKYDFTITGIIQDIPVNTHFHFDMLGTYSDVNNRIFEEDFSKQWGAYFGSYTYILLPESTSVKNLQEKTSDFIMKQREFPAGVSVELNYQKLLDIHLHSDYEGEIEDNNSISNILIVATIGLFILLLACFNFMNLATARSSQRMREIGVRKVLGAVRKQIVSQFLGEATLLALISLVFSFMLVELVLPSFSNLLNTEISFNFLDNFNLVFLIITGTIIVGIIAGIYPSFYLSGFKPAHAVKNMGTVSKKSGGGPGIRKVLVVAQFGISITLITCTIIVLQQLNYLKNHDVGFKKDHTITISFGADIAVENYQTLKNKFLSVPGVKNVTVANSAPISNDVYNTSLYPNGLDGGNRFGIYLKFVDFNFKDLYELKLVAGRFFSDKFADNWKDAMVVNESTVKSLGFKDPQDAIGKKYVLGIQRVTPTIIGVVKDFNIASLKSNIEPLVMMRNPEWFNEYSLRISPLNVSGTIAGLEKAWKEYSPDYPFTYSFLDDFISNLYMPEEKTGTIISTFSLLAILIACLGLIGLASFIFELRKKEIGIRKVLGAGILGLIKLLNSEFIKLVLIANIIAFPAAYYFMNEWLQNFAYKVNLSIWTFLFVGFVSILIAFLTISFQAVKAATVNPVKSLKYE
ncbi:ABC transporter permease [bacterium BMS3Abin03]|nr:ABC transporter permease [bacterium BMS3Abin03]